MDQPIAQKKWRWRPIAGWAGGGIGVLTLIYLVVFQASASSFKVARERLTINKVISGEFQDVIPITGTVKPIHSFYLDAETGGRVERILAEDGAFIKAGQALLQLSNTALTLDFMNRETQIVEQINNLRNTRINLEQTQRDINEQVLDIAFELRTMERQFSRDTVLYEQSVIARSEFEDSHARYRYLKQKYRLLVSGNQKDSIYRLQQLARIDTSLELMERNLAAIHKNLESLIVKAPVAGQLTGFNHQVGESKNKGEHLGRIDVLDGFKVSSKVDEHYLSRVEVGQVGDFLLSNRRLRLEVSKVLPEVINGEFEIELAFLDSIPSAVRRGQSLQIRLALSASSLALMVPRGGFYNTTGGNWVFVVTPKGEALKRKVRLGRQNTEFIEVLDGLEVGEEIVTSSYSNYGDAERLVIKI